MPGEHVPADPGPAPFLQLERSVEQRAQLERAQLLACQEVPRQAAHTKTVDFTALTWNLFHGRDAPPDRALLTWRSRLLRISETNATHAQVNRDLFAEFSALLQTADWDVALLQEAPPRWAPPLAASTRSDPAVFLTARNSFASLRRALTTLNPDLIASGEGGSNLTLVRTGGPLGRIEERRELVINSGRPERRVMGFIRTGSGVCVANLHATNSRPHLAAPEILRAARTATRWSRDDPLVFGGDLNLRPSEQPDVFDELRSQLSLSQSTAPRSIDHLLVRGLEITDEPSPWPAERRELREGDRAIRLSDHAPVSASFATR